MRGVRAALIITATYSSPWTCRRSKHKPLTMPPPVRGCVSRLTCVRYIRQLHYTRDASGASFLLGL